MDRVLQVALLVTFVAWAVVQLMRLNRLRNR